MSEPTTFFFHAFDERAPLCSVSTERINITRAMADTQDGLKHITGTDGETVLILVTGTAEIGPTMVEGHRQLAILPPECAVNLHPETTAWFLSPRQLAETCAWRRIAPYPSVYDMDELQPPADNPRLKMLQTDRMSLNWVHYSGPRDRSSLSPHLHEDFPQAGLALEGEFIHHLRTPWGRDARQWREDVHLHVKSPSIIDIPAGVEHTTEGINEGSHLLIDLFQPARRDYISRRWILNSADYQEV